MKTKTVASNTEAAIGWMAGAKERFQSVQQYLNKQYNIDKDKWYQLRFECACEFAESITKNQGISYHTLIGNEAYMNAFNFKWLENDVLIYDRSLKNDYMELKRYMMSRRDFSQFILSYINAPAT